MKKITLLFAFLALLVSNMDAQSSDQTTLPITFEDKKLEAYVICLDAIEAPTKYNEFAQPYIKNPSFPKKETSSTDNEYKSEIDNWLKDNPAIVEEIIVERKKAHDKLYGYRPY